ncbi:MAG: FkbM family methyltransferase [Reyranella sp.]|uniref:FkbM family methyltransferase n=1 Tax=Reyranella sp. TaxID=1929291 RepID=UPI003D14E595
MSGPPAPHDARGDRTTGDPVSRWALAEPRPGLRLWVDLEDYGVSRPCMDNAFEPLETAFVESYLRPGMGFVDVGANIGWYALLAAQRVGPKGGVIAIEPRPDSASRLAMSARENGLSNIVVHQVAAGAATGRMKVGALIGGRNPGGTWLLTTDRLLERTSVGHQRFDVDVRRLDDMAIGRCDLMKLDIEGAEHLMLQGALATIDRCRPVILSEINAEVLRQVSQVSVAEYVELLRRHGYRPHEVTATGPGRLVSDDALSAAGPPINVLFLPGETMG